MNSLEQREKKLFVEALELQSVEQRSEFLNQACGSDLSLRQSVEELLEAFDSSGRFIPERGLEAEDDPDSDIAEKPGAVIGRYKLLEQISTGTSNPERPRNTQ